VRFREIAVTVKYRRLFKNIYSDKRNGNYTRMEKRTMKRPVFVQKSKKKENTYTSRKYLVRAE